VLIATDIAARGIDVDGISHVINFDFPPQPEDYVHRIGRTGRMQAIGDAISFVTFDDADNLRRLERFLGRGITRKKLEGFVANASQPVATPRAPRGPRSGSFGPKRFGQRRSRPQGRRGRT
jgi:ATP-dependent RNA helicase RhlE